jgi:hypothetical protein
VTPRKPFEFPKDKSEPASEEVPEFTAISASACSWAARSPTARRSVYAHGVDGGEGFQFRNAQRAVVVRPDDLNRLAHLERTGERLVSDVFPV